MSTSLAADGDRPHPESEARTRYSDSIPKTSGNHIDSGAM